MRVIDPFYVKQKGMRSNDLKQRNRWSKERYTIKRVESAVGEMPRYDLADDGKATMYTHDQLILANVSMPVPADKIATERTYFMDKRVPDDDDDDFVYWSSFPLPERGSAVV